MIPDFSVRDKVIVITGGSGVLCSEMARELAALGAQVVILSRGAAKCEALAAEITAQGGTAMGVGCDVTDKAAVEAARDAVLARFGRVDVLINGAGGNHPQASATAERSFFDVPPEALRWVNELNLMGTVLPSQVFGAVMARQGSGSIINVASMSSLRPLTRIPGYSATKAAVANFTQWLATWFCENVSAEIRVNAIAPGFLVTDLNRHLLYNEQTGELTPRAQRILQQTPMARFGRADELVGAVVWLASDASRFVTGTVVPIDGGFAAYSI